jgi:8-oxo-dGTP diphosphatase
LRLDGAPARATRAGRSETAALSLRKNREVHLTAFDTRVAAYAVIVDDCQRVLLALWNGVEPPQWTMPGGGVDLAETVEQAVVREVREETGYEVRIDRLLGVHSHVVPPHARGSTTRPLKSVRVIFDAVVIGGELSNERDGTTDEARWFDIADITTLSRVPLVDVAVQMHQAAVAPPYGRAACAEGMQDGQAQPA